MAELFSITKAANLGGMVWFKAFKTMCVMGMIVVIGWAIYTAYVKPHYDPIKTTTQKAERIINNYNTPKSSPFGCASLRVIQYYKDKE